MLMLIEHLLGLFYITTFTLFQKNLFKWVAILEVAMVKHFKVFAATRLVI